MALSCTKGGNQTTSQREANSDALKAEQRPPRGGSPSSSALWGHLWPESESVRAAAATDFRGPGCRGAGRPFAFVGSALRIHRKGVRFKNLASTPQGTDSTARPPADSGPLGPPQASQHPPASPFQCPALRETHGRHPRVAPTSPGWAPAANTPD